MSFRWPIKDPDERLDYSIDWSRFLGTATISSTVWSVKSNVYNTETVIGDGQTLTAASSSATTDTISKIGATTLDSTSQICTIQIEGGVANREYTWFCAMTDSTGSIAKRSIKLAVRDK